MKSIKSMLRASKQAQSIPHNFLFPETSPAFQKSFSAWNSPKQKRLGIADTGKVCRCLFHLGAKWETIGIFLGIDPYSLEKIKEDGTDCNDKLIAMVKLWLKELTPPPTWEALVEVVQDIDPSKQRRLDRHICRTILCKYKINNDVHQKLISHA